MFMECIHDIMSARDAGWAAFVPAYMGGNEWADLLDHCIDSGSREIDF